MPARPNGITTVRIMPQRVAPEGDRALALADRRLGEHLAHDRGDVGSTTTPTATPAMNAEEVYDDGESGVSTRRNGSTGPKWTESHWETVSRWACRKNSAHIA